MYESISKFLSVEAVKRNCTTVSEDVVKTAWQARVFARNELMVYLAKYLGDEPVQCYVIFPFDDIEVTILNEERPFDSEFVYLPFGWFSSNLWNALLEDKENKLFQVLRYFSWNVKKIVEGVREGNENEKIDSLITRDVVNELNILDVFSLHSYIGVYKEVDKYLD